MPASRVEMLRERWHHAVERAKQHERQFLEQFPVLVRHEVANGPRPYLRHPVGHTGPGLKGAFAHMEIVHVADDSH